MKCRVVAEARDSLGSRRRRQARPAARICGHAEAGRILASVVIRELAKGKESLLADRESSLARLRRARAAVRGRVAQSVEAQLLVVSITSLF
jgi:predicted deacylase